MERVFFSTLVLQRQLLRMEDELNFGDGLWLAVQGESYSRLQTEVRRRFPDQSILIATIVADWGANYLSLRELYDTGIYQESIAVVASGCLEPLFEAIAEWNLIS